MEPICRRGCTVDGDYDSFFKIAMICLEMIYFFYWMGSMYNQQKKTKKGTPDVAKVALITGANRGIGLATARALRARGFKVFLGQ